MSSTSRRSGVGWDGETQVLAAVVSLFALVVAPVAVAVHLANRIDGSPQQVPADPIALLLGLARGTLRWPSAATWLLAAFAVFAAAVAAGALILRSRLTRSRSRVDVAARHMGRGPDLGDLTGRAAAEKATRLGMQAPGLVIATSVAGRRPLHQGWEDVAVHIWGPRTGKTTSLAVPGILDAPGAVIATSNKRDLVDATRDLRAAHGPVWVFDPQGIVDEEPSWWWNPLSYVVDEIKASVLADVFTSAAREPGARTDAYFDPRGQQLLADMLLAAALAGRDLTQVYLWLTRPTDDEPAAILREHGFPLNAASVDEAVNMAEKQRGGVYGTAQKTVAFMTNRQAMTWVTPDANAGAITRRQFDPAEFVRGRGTLYSLSKEGRGSAGPLVTALTIAVTEAAEDLAKRSAGGRLTVPMVAVLDEAANVCRWRELPNLYSHYGSRGIVLMTILQSWSQGVEVWGRDGMLKLWSAANVRTYGGGVGETDFLENLSRTIGDFELSQTSTSHSKSGRTTNRSTRRERVLDVADLAALPKGRVIILASGARPVLGRTLPWMEGPHAEAVKASIHAHDPAATQTITAAMESLQRVQHLEDAPTVVDVDRANPWVSAS